MISKWLQRLRGGSEPSPAEAPEPATAPEAPSMPSEPPPAPPADTGASADEPAGDEPA
jgi:hypothetical protein